MKGLTALSVLLASTSATGRLREASVDSTSRPVIGIYAAPLHHEAPGCENGCDYVAASYVKWLESAGAESLPIPYDSSNAEIEQIFPQVNGILFPGGGSSLPDGARHVFNLALQSNDNGTFFPVWGTCLGFEWLLELAAGSNVLQSGFDSENISMALNLTANAPTSRLCGPIASVPGHRDRTAEDAAAFRADLSNSANPPAMNNHQAGLEPSAFEANKNLSDFFTLLSTNQDRKGRAFVSTIEAKHYPVYGAQWHPEKNNFEWGMSTDGTPYESINHSPEAVFVSQSLVNFFVGEARNNNHHRNPSDPAAKLFWDYSISQVTAPEFQQCYIVPTHKGRSQTERRVQA